MSENIKPNATGVFYNTKIPSLADNANIQQALRMYHYGTSDGTPPDEVGDIGSESIAAYLGGLQTQIDALDYGSSYTSTEPAQIENGYVWVDADSAAPIFTNPPATIPSVARYQNSAPTTGLVDGMIWVDKDDQSKIQYVYDLSTTSWLKTGDLVKYQASAPATTNISEGTIWIDKDSSPLKMYVFDAILGWREVGA